MPAQDGEQRGRWCCYRLYVSSSRCLWRREAKSHPLARALSRLQKTPKRRCPPEGGRPWGAVGPCSRSTAISWKKARTSRSHTSISVPKCEGREPLGLTVSPSMDPEVGLEESSLPGLERASGTSPWISQKYEQYKEHLYPGYPPASISARLSAALSDMYGVCTHVRVSYLQGTHTAGIDKCLTRVHSSPGHPAFHIMIGVEDKRSRRRAGDAGLFFVALTPLHVSPMP